MCFTDAYHIHTPYLSWTHRQWDRDQQQKVVLFERHLLKTCYKIVRWQVEVEKKNRNGDIKEGITSLIERERKRERQKVSHYNSLHGTKNSWDSNNTVNTSASKVETENLHHAVSGW